MIVTLTRKAIKRAWHFLIRMDVVAILIAVLIILAAFGSCYPQRSSSMSADPDDQAQWEVGVRTRYGGLTGLLVAMGAFQFFSSPIFVSCLALLTISTLVCTLNRWRGLWRKAFRRKIRCADVIFDVSAHAARLFIPTTTAYHLLKESLELSGFRLQVEETGTVIHMRADRYRLGLVATLFTHLGLVLLISGGLISSAFSWREELTLWANRPATIQHLPDTALQYAGFKIERYPDGSVADYEAQVQVFNQGKKMTTGRLRLNHPLDLSSVGLYLLGFTWPEEESILVLAVYDPGYGIILVAGFLLLLGMAISFNFPHCCIYARLEPDGQLRLAGRAERRACDFDREFTTLIAELKRRAGPQVGEERPGC